MSTHKCAHPDCDVQVPVAMFGCRSHWFALPLGIRNAIWAAYRRWLRAMELRTEGGDIKAATEVVGSLRAAQHDALEFWKGAGR